MLPVAYTPIAEKYFKKLKNKQLKKAYKEAILSIRENPNIGDAKTGDLKMKVYCFLQGACPSVWCIYFISYPSVRYLNNLHM